MRRILLQYVLPLVLPLVIYGIWLAIARYRARKAGVANLPGWRDAPMTWLVVAGIGLVCVGFIFLAFQGGEPIGETYVPPRFIEGEIVPGRTE